MRKEYEKEKEEEEEEEEEEGEKKGKGKISRNLTRGSEGKRTQKRIKVNMKRRA